MADNTLFISDSVANMDASGDSTAPRKVSKTRLGGGKRSRREQAKEAARSRWQRSQASAEVGSCVGDETCVASTTVTVHGAAVEDSRSAMAGQEAANENEDRQPCNSSTSSKKLRRTSQQLGPTAVTDAEDERCFIELQSLKTLFTFVGCGHCGCVGSLDVCFGDHMGFSREIKVRCLECTFVAKNFSCAREGGVDDSITAPFNVNKAVVMAFNEIGQGHAGLAKFASIMNMPALHHKTYQNILTKVSAANVDVGETVLMASAEAVRETYKELNNSPDSGDEEGPLDVNVSFDGTWHKRGFTSNYGVGIVIETGLVLDYEVFFKVLSCMCSQ